MTHARFLGTLILACSLILIIPACRKGSRESARPVEPSPDLARRPLIWPAAEPGPYEVGYRVLHEYDSTRTFKPKFDYFGRPTEGTIARPIQISVWYPAAALPGLNRMKLEDYYFATATETDFAPPSAERLTILKNRLKNIWPLEFRIPPEGRAAIREKIEAAFQEEVFAAKDAAPEKGPFPLIVHMPGYNASPAHHAYLFEYLASHGYVVAAVPNMGRYRREIDDEAASLDVQARDLEFAVARMGEFPFVDPSRVGTTGMSWGGFSNVLFGGRDARVDAVLTLDGAITMPEELKLIEAVPGYSHKAFDKAYMQLLVTPSEAKFRPKDLRFFEALEYGDAHMVQFRGVDHDEFSCGYLRLRNLRETDPARVAYLEEFSRRIYRSALQFFDAYLKGDEKALHSLVGAAEGPDGSVTEDGAVVLRRFRKGKSRPLTRGAFIDIVRSRGAAEAAKIYAGYSRLHPGNDLIVSSSIGPVYMDAFESGDLKEALAICELWRTGLPNDPGPLFSLARVYAASGEIDKAIGCYEAILALRIDPEVEEAARKRLQEARLKRSADASLK
jgi:dienelactone hydrolase